MIKSLQGVRETVEFKNGASTLLHNQCECEDFPDHWHGPVEIIMPVENGYEAVCEKTAYTLGKDDILIIAPGTLHRLYAPPTGRRIIFQADFSILSGLREFGFIRTLIAPAIMVNQETFPEIHQELATLIYQIEQEYFSSNPLKEALIYSCLIRIFVLIGRQRSVSPAGTGSRSREYAERFLNTCRYIDCHFQEELSLDLLADMTGFSKYHFTRLFKQFTGISFYSYLNRCRISHAEQLLTDPQMSVTDAATQSGFNTLSSFIRMFKLQKGCTPSEFRSMHRIG